jgi:cytochrome c biogenesis protein CcmG/thiol:disulfide interchange protein DsbE
MKRFLYLLPVVLFMGLAGVFLYQLKWGTDPQAIPSVLIDKKVPPLDLPGVPGRDEQGLKTAHITGNVSLVNIFGSWCVACVAEHPMLLEIRKSGMVPVHGIDWNEKNPADGGKWLKRNGDPYDRVGLDLGPPRTNAAIDFGVTGAPETFVVDKSGHIRYKHVGPITPEAWKQTLLPMIKELQKQ